MKFQTLIVGAVLLLVPTSTYALDGFPAFPMAFWGTVTTNGTAAPVGSVVRAYYGSTLAGTATVQEAGVYGYTEPTKQKLIVAEGTGAITFKIQATGFNSGAETGGTTPVTYSAFTSGLTVQKGLAFNITVPDTASPVITLHGGDVTIYQGTTYVDAGATALDNVEGDITSNIVINSCGFTGAPRQNVGSSGGGGAGSCCSGFGGSNGVSGLSCPITYNISDAASNHAIQITRTVTILNVSSSAQLLSENTTVSTSNPEVLVGDNNTASSIITIPSSVTNATVNVSAITTSTANSTTATLQGSMTINASTAIGAVKVEIPAGIQIVAGTPTWNGIINVPQVKENSTVTATPDSGKTSAVSSVIEVGYGDVKLTFDKGVRLKIAGQAGKYVGYSRSGVFTTITTVCSADSQAVGDALPLEGDCKIDIGSDLVVWTKHFTNFVTYTQTTTPASSSSSSSSGGGGGGGGAPAPTPTTSASAKGDATGDGKVDVLDFNSLLIQWGKAGTNLTADLDKNGAVDIFDFNLLLINWSR